MIKYKRNEKYKENQTEAAMRRFTITDTDIDIRNLGKRYETYLAENRDWLLEQEKI
jgi:hypothetical protein